MDEQSNRRLLFLIAGLVLVVATFSILTLKQFVADIDGLFPWPTWLAVLFNLVVLVATALVTVGHLELRPVAKFFGLVLVCKAIETVLTAAGFLLTGSNVAVGQALHGAGLGSLSASILHVIGALVVARVLRDVVMGRELGVEAPAEGIILPGLSWLETGTTESDVDEEPRLELEAAEQEPENKEELDRVVAAAAPEAAEQEPESEEELDRVVAAAAPVTADLEAMPDEPVPEPEPIEIGGPADVVLSVSDILGCFPAEEIALTADEVLRERGGDDRVRVPLDAVLSQLDKGVVLVEPDVIFSQLPRATFKRLPEAIVADLAQGKIELPLARVVAQVLPEALLRSYVAEQEKADVFPDLFEDTLAASRVPAERVEPAEEEKAPAVEAPPARSSTTLAVSAEYVVAQFPENATGMSIEDIEAKLEPRGKLHVALNEVLPQLSEGHVAVDVRPLLKQLPPGAVVMSWADLAAALPGGKVRLPLEQVVSQVPSDELAPGLAQVEQETAEEIPEPFEELRPAVAVEAAPSEAEEAPESAPEDVVEIPWLELLPQFPPDAFSVSREQVRKAIEGKAARMEMSLVRPQLAKGRITVPCGYLLAQFPAEYLELSIEQIAERMPEARFDIPLPTLILRLPVEELALPEEQAFQESAEEIPTVFAEPGTEPEAAPEAAEPAPEPMEYVPIEVFETAPPGEEEEVPAAEPEPEPVPEPEPTPVEEVPEPAAEEVPEVAEPVAASTPTEGLTDEDVAQVEALLGSKREEKAAPEYEGESLDELFVPEEPEAPIKVRIEPVEEPAAEVAAEAEAPEEAAPEAAPMPTGVAETVRESETFRDLLAGYSKYHIEHGSASLQDDCLVLSFAPAEISDEKLAHELPPRLEALGRFAERLGCGSLDEVVMVADKGAVVCKRLPTETGSALVLIATTDKQAAGVVHLQARRDTGLLNKLSSECRAAHGPAWSPSLRPEPEGCEIERPAGRPYEEISTLLGPYGIRTVALLRFASGGQWVLASSGEASPEEPGWYNPDELVRLPDELWLGNVRSVLAQTERNVVIMNPPARSAERGLICVFPDRFREGLLRMKTDKASALLCGV